MEEWFLVPGIPIFIQFVQSVENNYAGWLDELIIIDGTYFLHSHKK